MHKFVNKVTIYDNDDDGDKVELDFKVPDTLVSLPTGYTVSRPSAHATVHPHMVLHFEIDISIARRQRRK